MWAAARAPGVAAEARRPLFCTRPRPRGPGHPRLPKSDYTDSDPCGASLSPPQAGAEDARPPPGCTATCPCSSVVHWPPVAVPGALGIAALFHGHLMQRAPVCRARRVARPLAPVPLAGGLAGAGGLLGRQGLLHGLLDAGPAGRRVAWRDGGCGTAVGPADAASRCWRRSVKVGLPLPCLVEHILHPRHQVLHAAGEFRVAHVPHRVHEFDLTHAQPQATAGRGFVDVPAVRAGEPLLAGVLAAGGVAAGGASALGGGVAPAGASAAGRGAAGRGRACRAGPVPGGAARPRGVCLHSSARCVASAQGQSGARR